MPKVNAETMTAIKIALESYIEEVEAAPLSDATMRTYCLHARHFVRWLDDEFEPGATIPRR